MANTVVMLKRADATTFIVFQDWWLRKRTILTRELPGLQRGVQKMKKRPFWRFARACR